MKKIGAVALMRGTFWSRMGGGGLLLLLLVGSAPVRGQNASAPDSTVRRPYQIGFAASNFVKLLEEEGAPGRYQVYGRYQTTSRWALRTAVRYQQFVGDDQELRVGARFGADRQLVHDGRFHLYGGADVMTGYDRFLNGDRRYRVGVAPVLGLLFRITPNISLSTEPRLAASYAYSQNEGPVPDAESVSIKVRGVGQLILSVHF